MQTVNSEQIPESGQAEPKQTTKKKHSSVGSSILKWAIILGLLIFVWIHNEDLMEEALYEIQVTPLYKLFICLILGNLYYIAEGVIISEMTKTCDHRLTVWQGIVCAYLCTFYRLATLGSGTGVAQLYYYNLKGIRVSTGTGMCLAQYTFQKIVIGVFGVAAFVLLLISGHAGIRKYIWYMFAGAVVISVICLFLFILTVSTKFSDFVMKLAHRLVKEKNKLYPQLEKAQTSIDYLQEQGRLVWKDKKLFLTVAALDVAKFACWYAIPGVFFSGDYGVSIITCLLLTAVCNMVGCVMLAPSGVGTLEFCFAIFFGAVIADGDAVAAALVIYRLFTWIVPFVIGIVPALAVRKKQ